MGLQNLKYFRQPLLHKSNIAVCLQANDFYIFISTPLTLVCVLIRPTLSTRGPSYLGARIGLPLPARGNVCCPALTRLRKTVDDPSIKIHCRGKFWTMILLFSLAPSLSFPSLAFQGTFSPNGNTKMPQGLCDRKNWLYIYKGNRGQTRTRGTQGGTTQVTTLGKKWRNLNSETTREICDQWDSVPRTTEKVRPSANTSLCR